MDYRASGATFLLLCGHDLHSTCLVAFVQNGGLKCPTCSKSVLQRKVAEARFYKRQREEIAASPLPQHLNKQVRVYCNDCSKEFETTWHPFGHECTECHGFNTNRV